MIYSFGDSFTVGLGADYKYEQSLLGDHPDWSNMSETKKNSNRKIVYDYRVKNSFTHFFSELINQDYDNKGFIGCNNNYIVDYICNEIVGGVITDKDLVLINFTSSLRNYPSFLPHFFTSRPEQGVEGITFGQTEYDDYHDLEDVGGHLKNELLTKFNGRGEPFYKYIGKYKQTYLRQSFSFDSLDYYNQNLIIFLQNLLSHYDIKYLMFDAFDPMVNTTNINYTKFIDQSTYWEFNKNTIWSFLNEKNDDLLLEDRPEQTIQSKKHPSKAGHKFFATELNKLYKKKYSKILI